MKKIIFFLGIISFIACKKDTTTTSGIIGSWVWVKSTAFSPTIVTPASSGKTWSLVFNSDSSFVQSGTLVTPGSGSFSIENSNYYINDDSLFLKFPSYTSRYNYRFVTDDSLRISENEAVDGPVSFFSRVK